MTTRIVHFGRTRTAALLLLLGLSAVTALLAVRPAAAYGTTRPDLQVSVALKSAWWTSYSDRYEQFAVTVTNPAEYDGELHAWFGGPAAGVTVQYTIPEYKAVQSVSAPATSYFSCAWSGRVVTCTGGSLARNGSVPITVVTKDTQAVGVDVDKYCVEQHYAVVDPTNTIVERDETNNTFSGTIVNYSCWN